MNIRELKQVIPVLLNNGMVPFLWGGQGIGKTQATKQIVEQHMKKRFIPVHVGSTCDVGDIIGLAKIVGDEFVHTRPVWFPTDGEGVIFLDELNRAHPDILQALFSFVQTGKLHTHQLPPGWKVMAAGNYQNEGFTVTDTSDSAWSSRFVHIDVKPDAVEFASYASSQGANLVADFILENKEFLTSKENSSFNLPYTLDPRRWLEQAQPIMTSEDLNKELKYELLCGVVGTTAASRFTTWAEKREKTLRLSDVLNNYKAVQSRVVAASDPKETRFDVLSVPVEELEDSLRKDFNYLERKPEYMVNLVDFLCDVPLELVSQVSKRLSLLRFAGKTRLMGDAKLVNRIKKSKE